MRFAGAVLLLLSWLVAEHIPPWVSWHSDAVAFFAVFAIAWLALARHIRGSATQSIPFPSIAWPFAALAGIAVIQAATGLITFWGDVVLVIFFMALCVVTLTLGFVSGSSHSGVLLQREHPVLWLAGTLVAGGVISTTIAFAQVFELWDQSTLFVRIADLSRASGNLAQPNQLATLLVMSLASVAFLHACGRMSAVPSGLVVLFLCMGIAATASRSGVISVLCLLAWWATKRKLFPGPPPLWLAIGVGGLFMLMFMGWPMLLNKLQLLDFEAQNRMLIGSARFDVWPQLLEAALQHFWWGWGMLETAKAHNAVAHAYVVSGAFTYSHNIVLDFMLWIGLPLAVGLFGVTLVWVWRRVCATDGVLPWYCLAVLLPMAVHSMLEFPFAYAYLLVPVMFLLGVLEASLGSKPLLRLKWLPVGAVLAVSSLALAWSVVEYFAIEEDFRIARFETLRVGQTPADYQPPNIVLFTQLKALVQGTRISPRPAMSPPQLSLLRDLALRYPWPATQSRYALALALNNQPDEAVRQYQVMRAQYGDKLYQRVKKDLAEQARADLPQLRALRLP